MSMQYGQPLNTAATKTTYTGSVTNEMAEYLQAAVDEYRADLRAKVEALWLTQIIPPKRDTYGAAIKDVLALIDGGSDA